MKDDADFLRTLDVEASDVQQVPDDSKISRLRDACAEMVSLSDDIDAREEKLNRDKERLWEMKTKTLVDMMHDAGVDNIGVSGSMVDVKLVPHTHANIKSEWDDERREAGFVELDRVGGGDIVKNNVTFAFSRNQDTLVRAFLAVVESEEFGDMLKHTVWQDSPGSNEITLPTPVRQRAVLWNTLTAFVKEQVKKGTVLDLEKLGATVGQIVKIEKRKAQ